MLQDKITFYGVKLIKYYHCLNTIQLKQFYNNIPNFSCYNLEKMKTLRFCFDLDNTLVTYPKIPNDYLLLNQLKKQLILLDI